MSPLHDKRGSSCVPAELASNQEQVEDIRSPFLRAPLEIRNQIYQYLLSTKYCKVDFRNEEPTFLARFGQEDGYTGVYRFNPAILAVNREIHYEASQILHDNLFVRLTLSQNIDAGALPVVAKGELACRVSYPVIEVSIMATEERSHLNIDPRSLMFAGDDMETFCRILLRLTPLQGSLLITDTGLTQTTKVMRLLEPFGSPHCGGPERITGQTEVAYRSDTIMKMLKQARKGDLILQEIQKVTEEGDQAASIHDYSTAISRFKKAFDDSDDAWTLPDMLESTVKNGDFKGENLVTAFFQTTLTSKIKLATMYVKLKNHVRAFEWARLALGQIGHFCHTSEPYSRGETVRQEIERIGLVVRAIREFKLAAVRDPELSKIAADLESLRGRRIYPFD